MSKTSGLGDNLYIGGVNLSGDIGSLSSLSTPVALQEVTGIDKSAPERIQLRKDGMLSFTAFFNPSLGQAHPTLSALPTADVGVMYCRGTTLGNPSACMVGKQINYDGTEGEDGSLVFKVDAQANGYGLEWGVQLTAGRRTDTAATNGTGVDTGGSLSLGGQAYLQVFSLTGTDVTVKIQDSADNVTFADVTSLAFAQTTTAPGTQRISIGNTATIRRYVRASTTTSAGFTSATFAVVLVKNTTAGVTF